MRWTWGRLWVCAGGSAVPAERGFHEAAGELRESPGRRRMKRGTGPNPYAKAATGPEEQDPEQPKRKRKEEMGGWARENTSMWAGGRWTRETTSKAEPTNDVAMQIRLCDLPIYETTTPPRFTTSLPSTQAARKLACLSLHQVRKLFLMLEKKHKPPVSIAFSNKSTNASNVRHYYDDDNLDARRETFVSDTPTEGLYDQHSSYDPYTPHDIDSDGDVYTQRYATSADTAVLPGLDAYPAWSAVPLSKEEIEDIFLNLTQKFGFQRDSMWNMFDFSMQQLDSRASRMSPNQALLTLHADYIGGQHANYHNKPPGPQPPREKALNTALERWRQAMHGMGQYDRLRQIALYLLCWGEGAQVRFCPETLCFIFKCADDYYRSPECQNRGYEVVDGKFVWRERDHEDIIGYDDINQLFWYRGYRADCFAGQDPACDGVVHQRDTTSIIFIFALHYDVRRLKIYRGPPPQPPCLPEHAYNCSTTPVLQEVPGVGHTPPGRWVTTVAGA
ncbi:hypothetical protein B0H14DRAFT_3890398 [Mycena olivaceomarginata]|nr:hypothetical protein B0H14DRAFT_3890398 [Mycena olivaceomarginata]